ncbi:MAG: hypothetical protein ACR2OZ_10405 [Verrucomicrobiales bacterium]
MDSENGLQALRVFAVSGEAKLITQTLDFANSSETRLLSDLRISGAATVAPGALFNGSGTLIVDATGTLRAKA